MIGRVSLCIIFVLCCVCCVVLCCVVLCGVKLCCVVLCCVVLRNYSIFLNIALIFSLLLIGRILLSVILVF